MDTGLGAVGYKGYAVFQKAFFADTGFSHVLQ